MNQKLWNQICCIALIGWIFFAVQLFFTQAANDLPSQRGADSLPVGGSDNSRRPLVVLDAGHGGMDPGKVGVTGAKEKDINLSVVGYLKELLEQNDVTVVLTRSDDNGLYSKQDKNKKSADMRERIRILTETSPVLAVSIHQNSFTNATASGTQVFYYGGSEQGKKGATLIQEAMKRELRDGNRRMAKANTSYYMLKKSPCPLVIIECGFLSNPEEEQKLLTSDYQRKVAWAAHLGIMEWLRGY